MMVLVTYDVRTDSAEGRRRLRKVARVCEGKGQRVQNSVFECLVDAGQWAGLRASLLGIADAGEDSLRFYFLGSDWKGKVEHHGAKPAWDPEGPLVV